MAKRLDSCEMMKKCIEKHGTLYKYDFSNFKTDRKIDIECSIHGIFRQNYYDHIKKGCGCPKCSGVSKLSNQEFTEKANKIHDNFYDYSQINYVNFETKIKILCPIHGEFKQTPHSHLRGDGCFYCGMEKTRNGNLKSNIEFVKKANEIHNNSYEYIEKYTNQKKKIKILCKKHGIFEQTPKYHLQGNGCQKCAKEFKGAIKSNEEFIRLSNEIHNYKYDYSKTFFKFATDKIIIICPIHGEFIQRANSHIAGIGCYKCKSSKGEKIIAKILEKNGIEYTPQKKFKECKNIKLLPFDFYLENYYICIEYDGEQHYIPKNHFGGISAFNEIKKRDAIKEKFCLENKIELIRIKYNDNIEEKMNGILEMIKNKSIYITK